MGFFSWRAIAPDAPRLEPSIERPARRAMTIRPDAVAAIGAAAQQPVRAFEVAKPFPGVVPTSGAPSMATDAAIGSAYDYAGNGMYGEGLGWLGYAYLAELSQRPEYRKLAEVTATELTRKWIKLEYVGEKENADKLAKLDAAMKRLHVQDMFRRAAEQDGFFGRSQIYLDTGAGDKPDELKTPLTISKAKIGKGGLKRLSVIEPIWTYPNDYNSADPLRADYFRPKSWFVQGKLVHSSRLLTFVSREMPDLLKPAYNFGGLSLSQLAKPYIDNWLRTRQSISDLIHSFSTPVLSTNLDTIMNAGSSQDLIWRAETFNRTRDNRGLMMLDKEKEEFSNVSTPLGTLDHLQAQSQEQMASVASMPLVKLLGITPSGLNASSDGEIRVWYDWIESQQESLFRDNLTRLIQIIQLSEFGDIDEGIGFRFESLWQMDDAAKAVIRKTDADVAIEYIAAGVLSPHEERERLADAEDSLYVGIDVDDDPVLPDPSTEEGPTILSDPAKGAEPRGEEASGV
jgi:uncharacterized protein